MRIDFVDTAKGLLIVLMVIGHSGAPIVDFIYLFHMASFIFFSGFVFNGKENVWVNIKKKIKRIYFSYLKYSILFIVLYPSMHILGIIKNPEHYNLTVLLYSAFNVMFFGGGINELVGPLWFLVLLFEVAVLYVLLFHLVKSLKLLTGFIIFIFVFTFILLNFNIQFPRYTGVAFIMLLIFHAGYCFKLFRNYIKINLIIAILSLLILIYLSFYFKINIGKESFGNPFIFLLASFCGIYLQLYLIQIFRSFRIFSILSNIGKNTIEILVWHLLFFKIFTFFLVYVNYFPYEYLSDFPVIRTFSNYTWIGYSLVGIFGPYLIIILSNNMFAFIKKNLNTLIVK